MLQQINNLVNLYQNKVAKPQSVNSDQLDNLLTSINAILEESEINNFSPSWHNSLEELGIEDVLGIKLSKKLNILFSSNNLDKTFILNEIKGIFQKISSLNQAINQFTAASIFFDFDEDSLDEDEYEIGFIIPRKTISNNFTDLIKELKDMEQIFDLFSEIAYNEKKKIELKTISSTDPAFYLLTLPAIVGITAKSIKWILDLYKEILDIKKIKKELETKTIPDDLLDGLNNHIEDLLSNGIKKIVPQIMNEYSNVKDEHRENELKNGLGICLKKMAKKIDQGYVFEVRISKAIDESKTENNSENYSKIVEIIREIDFQNTGEEIFKQLETSE